MKKTLVTLSIVAIAAIAPSAWATETDTENMSVTANVATVCTVDSAATLAFGTYANSAINNTAAIKVTCVAADAKATLSLDDGANLKAGTAPQLRQMKSAQLADHFLSYDLKATNDEGACWGSANVCTAAHAVDVDQTGTQQSFTVYGAVAGSQGLYAGSYSDTVVVTVTF